jgi:hypothetical protein
MMGEKSIGIVAHLPFVRTRASGRHAMIFQAKKDFYRLHVLRMP